MLSRLNNQYLGYVIVLLFTLIRVIHTRILECPPDFDCNAYLSMVDHGLFNPDIAGHHAMRLFPVWIVKLLTTFGLSKTQGFYLLSSGCYIATGLGVYYILLRLKVHTLVALSFSLLCLAPHRAMIIPLQLVYQACDILVYPLILLLFYFSVRQNLIIVFIVGLIAALTRQNIFILGLLSIIYLGIRPDTNKLLALLYGSILILLYGFSQFYFQASGTFAALLTPPAGYFSITHLSWVFWDSGLLLLILPIAPLILLNIKPIFGWFWQYWHLGVYMVITVGQPFLGYHLTGENFPRLALQGIWVLYICLGCISLDNKIFQVKWFQYLFLIYSIALYFTWGISQRLVILAGFTALLMVRQRYAMRECSDGYVEAI